MRTSVTALLSALSFCVMLNHKALAQNLAPNPSFELRNQEPQGLENIAPNSGQFNFDDLPLWRNVLGTPDYSSSTTGLGMTSTYTTVGFVNTTRNTQYARDPAYAPFYPRTGTGCVQLAASPFQPGYEEAVGTTISGLQIGHKYQASFYALRRPKNHSKWKLSLTVHNMNTVPTWVINSSVYGFVPEPYAIITSDYITDSNNWTLVSGTFVARATTQAIAIGYEYADNQHYTPKGVEDYSLDYVPYPTGNDAMLYAIDDVAVIDQGCYTSTPVLEQLPNYNPCSYPAANFQITNYDPLLTYRVSVPIPGPLRTSGNVRSNGTFVVNVASDGGVVTVTATSVCGSTSSTQSDVIYVPCEMAERTQAAPAYPNPATESLTLPAGTRTATLLNSQGQPVGRADESGRIEVRALPAGLYDLQTRQNGKVLNQRIEVKH